MHIFIPLRNFKYVFENAPQKLHHQAHIYTEDKKVTFKSTLVWKSETWVWLHTSPVPQRRRTPSDSSSTHVYSSPRAEECNQNCCSKETALLHKDITKQLLQASSEVYGSTMMWINTFQNHLSLHNTEDKQNNTNAAL